MNTRQSISGKSIDARIQDAREEWGTFPELNARENMEIWHARAYGMGQSYPCIPTAQAQADNTLAAARRFNADRAKPTGERYADANACGFED